MTFLSNTSSNHQFQLATTAVVSGLIVAGAILGYQRLAHEERLSELKNSIPSLEDDRDALKLTTYGGVTKSEKEAREDARSEALARRAQAGDYDDELILEQLARNQVFLTPGGLSKLREAFIIVVGCGGVGSHATASLARSGASRIRLIDFDQVTLSSLNRHAVATLADVGTPKVTCLQRRLAAIVPWVKFDLRGEKFWDGRANELLSTWKENGRDTGRRPDFVIDAIDNIDTKVALLKYCHDHQLPVISAMGAGCKSDPTRIVVGDIGTGTDDGLSRATRRKLKLLGVTSGIPTVYSTERTGEGKAELLPLPEDEFKKGSVGDLGVLPEFRVRILPVLGTMPAVFGYTVANHVILSVTGYPHDYLPPKGREKTYEGILALVQSVESKIVRKQEGGDTSVTYGLRVPVTAGDVAFLVEEVFKGRSAVTGLYNRLTLIRWKKPTQKIMVRIGDGADEQKSSNLRISHLVCMTKDEATRHEKKYLLGDEKLEELYDEATIASVEARLKEATLYEKYR